MSVAGIFQLRLMIGNITGKDKVDMPNIGLFEIEDVFYLLPLVTFFDLLQPFLIMAAIGTPVFALWTLGEYLKRKRGTELNSVPTFQFALWTLGEYLAGKRGRT